MGEKKYIVKKRPQNKKGYTYVNRQQCDMSPKKAMFTGKQKNKKVVQCKTIEENCRISESDHARRSNDRLVIQTIDEQ